MLVTNNLCYTHNWPTQPCIKTVEDFIKSALNRNRACGKKQPCNSPVNKLVYDYDGWFQIYKKISTDY